MEFREKVYCTIFFGFIVLILVATFRTQLHIPLEFAKVSRELAHNWKALGFFALAALCQASMRF